MGLGWHIVDRKNGERWLNHGGGMGGYTAIVNINVDRKIAVIVLSNLGNAHDLAQSISELGRALLKMVEARSPIPILSFGSFRYFQLLPHFDAVRVG